MSDAVQRASPSSRRAARPELLVRELSFGPPSRIAGLPTFVALDFETADARRDSACSLAVVRVEGGAPVAARSCLIRPPRPPGPLPHERIHGITWAMVARAPPFIDVWARCAALLDGAALLVAHNAPFDRSVLYACCAGAGLRPPALPFACTVERARRAFGMTSARLPLVCRRLGIPLEHHDPLSDALACARVMVATMLLLGDGAAQRHSST